MASASDASMTPPDGIFDWTADSLGIEESLDHYDAATYPPRFVTIKDLLSVHPRASLSNSSFMCFAS